MSNAFTPQTAADVERVVAWAASEGTPLEIVGRGTKRAIGRNVSADAVLDLSGLRGVTLYEPEELVLSAGPGTPLAEIEGLLASHGQELAFEPMHFGPLLGAPDSGSLGGAIAANSSGPRRIKAGAARDHFLGFTAVSGRGETFKSGGRVVKNVTGYDLSKLLAGSWGTLAAMTAVTVKTLPRAETERTLAVAGLDAAGAITAMSEAMGSSCEVSAAAHLPPEVACAASPVFSPGMSATLLRVEGIKPSVAGRIETLSTLMKPFGAREVVPEEISRGLWRAIRDVTPFSVDGPLAERPVWRISTAPTQGAVVARAITSKAPDCHFIFDWAGGLVWSAVPPCEDGGAGVVRTAVAASGGHATLVRAPAAIRAEVDVFEPQLGPLGEVTRRIKQSFDPSGILNPGRMWPGV